MTAFASSRRDILRAGGATLFLALVGGKLRAADAAGRPLPEGDAYAPWTLWNDPSIRNTPLALVAAGVIAANPHDTQPWLFAVSDDAIEIYADTSRNLGAMDAYFRELHLGLGCAIENMLTAAGANGYAAQLETAPGSLIDLTERNGPVLAARLRLRGSPRPPPTRATPPSRFATPTATPTIRRGRRRRLARLRARARRRRRGQGVAVRSRLAAAPRLRRRRRRGDGGDHRRQADDRRQRPLVPRLVARDRRPSRRADARRRRPLDLHADLRASVFGVGRDQPARLARPDPRCAAADRAGRRPDRRARPLRPSRRDRRGPRLAAPPPRRDLARHGAAAAQPADRDDRPRTPDRRGFGVGAARRRPDGRGLAGDVLVSRRVFVDHGERRARAAGSATWCGASPSPPCPAAP